MSTDGSRRARARRRRSRAFVTSFAIVIGILAVLGLAAAAISVAQGPRVTGVQVDPDAAVAASGSRMIITTTQSLQEITPEQVTVTPAADFTVDTSGRSIGIRFALPLWDETDYAVTVTDVTGIGGGPAATIEESFTTPGLTVFVLTRSAAGDTIFRTDLVGDAAEPVYTHEHIEDFRATSSHLVVSTVDDDGLSHVIVTDLDGTGERDLPLPGDGVVSNLQSADRGNLVGYTFTDASISADSGRESELFTASLNAAEASEAPTAIERPGGDSRVGDWRFVPGTDSILMITFDGALTLASSAGGEPVALGNALTIEGIARGSTVAVVQRTDAPVAIDLATAEETPLSATDPALGQLNAITPLADGSTLRVLAQLDGFTVSSTSVDVVDAEGVARSVFAVEPTDTLMETCVSPSGRYAAFLVAPDVVDNPYDGYLLPLPERVQTHVVALGDGTEVVTLSGFDISWCQTPPRG
ncbi:hypothetical protein [Microbacterium memoriense]|uniref:SbsA Ig-like domain-containing protein n=1 Tax=Microbacterium memoriense TaxID=2978350 RepID=A0ABT2PHE1_9MICO|nr:hypothetical protein [Microbacterium memoriense]MCT9003014.1 hypothetical protein [Microbacterium memoriense]